VLNSWDAIESQRLEPAVRLPQPMHLHGQSQRPWAFHPTDGKPNTACPEAGDMRIWRRSLRRQAGPQGGAALSSRGARPLVASAALEARACTRSPWQRAAGPEIGTAKGKARNAVFRLGTFTALSTMPKWLRPKPKFDSPVERRPSRQRCLHGLAQIAALAADADLRHVGAKARRTP
jgi:hypothetical protein